MLASMQVVTLRTTRFALAGPLPDEPARREFGLMSREKGQAVSESIQALGSGIVNLAVGIARDGSEHLWATSAAAATMASSRSFPQWLEHQAELVRLAADYPAYPLKMVNSSACLMQQVLAPIHGRAIANAKRLSTAP
ncbi:hypothetical protein PPGU19_101010 (plasmid) [Paraburkholderia sp. PGU19]|nr:hypothetical protein PPGU19_101010 [Paraburkholderia sp. PGU19]